MTDWEERAQFARISDHPRDTGHARERLRLELGRAAGDQYPGVGPPPVRAADGLARLAHGLVRHRAAVDDDPVLIRRSRSGDRLAFREVQPAAERDRLDAHRSASRSSSPLNTWVAAP